MGWSIARRWSRGSELILAPWEGSVTQHDDMATSIGGEVTPGRGKGRYVTSLADANLTEPKNEIKHTVDSTATNGWWRFKSNDELI
jgi:hypothetical protein